MESCQGNIFGLYLHHRLYDNIFMINSACWSWRHNLFFFIRMRVVCSPTMNWQFHYSHVLSSTMIIYNRAYLKCKILIVLRYKLHSINFSTAVALVALVINKWWRYVVFCTDVTITSILWIIFFLWPQVRENYRLYLMTSQTQWLYRQNKKQWIFDELH